MGLQDVLPRVRSSNRRTTTKCRKAKRRLPGITLLNEVLITSILATLPYYIAVGTTLGFSTAACVLCQKHYLDRMALSLSPKPA